MQICYAVLINALTLHRGEMQMRCCGDVAADVLWQGRQLGQVCEMVIVQGHGRSSKATGRAEICPREGGGWRRWRWREVFPKFERYPVDFFQVLKTLSETKSHFHYERAGL